MPTVIGPKNKRHQVRLIYFNARGRAEYIRIALALAGVEYEDVRVDHETFSQLKQDGKLPFNQLPVLEFDGIVLAQSLAILRFIATEFDLYGSSLAEKARVDVICEGLNDIWSKYSQAKSSPKDVQVDTVAKFGKDVLPVWLGYMTTLLKENNGGTGFFVGDKPTIADVLSYTTIGQTRREFDMKAFPLILQHYERIDNLPAVTGWIKKRPDSVF